MSDQRLSLRISNELAELTRVAEQIDQFCAANAISTDCAFKLNIALEELLTNIISYGYEDTARHEIALDVTRTGDELVAELSDDARAFDPLSVKVPDFEVPIEKRHIGGLGVHLVKTMMDQVTYAYHDGRNHLTLRKRVAPQS